MRKLIFRLSVALIFVLSVFVLAGCTKETEEELSYVTISTNPSVELVVDKKGVVLAANGVNDDGKLLLEGEELVGKKIEVASELVISLTEELGFTLQGEVKADSQKVEISVSSNTVEIAKSIENKVKNEVQTTIDELGIALKLEVEESKTKDYFVNIALVYDPSLTKEEANSLTMKELLIIVKEATKEKAQFISVELEKYYQELKAYEFKIYYKQEIATALENGYQQFLTGYRTMLEQFSAKIKELNELKVYTFTNPESEYVKAMDKYQEAKEKLMSQKVQLSVTIKAGSSTAALEAQIKLSELALEVADKAVEAIDLTIRASFDALIQSLEQIYASLEELEKEFPTEINFEEKLTNAENYINNNKKELFDKFEESINEDTLKALEEKIKVRKEELKTMVEETKEA